MCKSEIFAKIINIVSKETEVSVDQILSSDENILGRYKEFVGKQLIPHEI